MAPKKHSAVRVAGRRQAATSKTAAGAASEFALPDWADVARPGEEVGPPPDPAALAASIMLASGLRSAGLTVADLSGPGVISLVLTPAPEWVGLVRCAWANDVSGKDSTGSGARERGYYRSAPETLTFECGAQPTKYDCEHADEKFARAVGLRARIVGISSNQAWLSADLVAAADRRIELAPLSPGDVADLARKVTSLRPSLPVQAEDAAAVSPRLARLAARPRQTADGYLRKLVSLVDADRAKSQAAAVTTRTLGVRAGPTLECIHGMDEAVAWGWQLRDDLQAFKTGARSWTDVDRGLLLSGPPGTGKTLFARALAASCGVPLVSGSYGIWLGTGSGHQGDLLRAMRKCFKDAKESAPSILFIDEVDAFGDRARVRHYPEWHTEVINTLLAEIDGVESRDGVVVLAACNNPDKLDPALVRSGRLDRHIRVDLPCPAALAAILRVHLADELPGEDLQRLGLLLLGATGADVERLVRGARRRARLAGRVMEAADIAAEAGCQDRRSADDLRVAAVHEAGHAVAAIILGLHVDGVAIRGSSGGGGRTRTHVRSHLLTSADVHDRLVALLSGRAAEEVILKRVTSGAGGPAGSDLQRATWLAAESAAELGLEQDHGLAWTPLPDREAELSGMLAADHRLAALVRDRLAIAYARARDLMERSEAAVQAVADDLLAKGALDGDEVCRIVGRSGDRS